MEKGGVAGPLRRPRGSPPSGDELVPVPLRLGDRTLGGVMTWEQPLQLAPFPPTSPFAGLPMPEDVRISRQVLAEPTPTSPTRRWPRSRTARRWSPARSAARGALCWSTPRPTPSWSNLPLSGLFVDMLRRSWTCRAGGRRQRDKGSVEPSTCSTASAACAPPRARSPPIAGREPAATPPAPDHPPGLYATERAASPAATAAAGTGWRSSLQPARPERRAARPRDAGPGAVALRPRA